jgi:hypothetical protein
MAAWSEQEAKAPQSARKLNPDVRSMAPPVVLGSIIARYRQASVKPRARHSRTRRP